MVDNSRFFADGTNYTQIELAEALASFKDGYVENKGNELVVTESSPQAMSVDLDTGDAWVQGYFYNNDASKTLTVQPADATNPRIDTVILRLSVTSTLDITSVVLEGTPAASPVAPTLTQTSVTYEIALYDIAVAAGATTILNANLTDRRSIGGIGELDIPSATESVEGKIRKASTAEMQSAAGGSTPSDEGAITPEKLTDYIDEVDEYSCYLILSADQTSGNEIIWNGTPIYDAKTMRNATNNEEIDSKAAGKYQIDATIVFTNLTASDEIIGVDIYKNGSTIYEGVVETIPASTNNVSVKINAPIILTSSDTLVFVLSVALSVNFKIIDTNFTLGTGGQRVDTRTNVRVTRIK